jgi:hypothetical protein
LDLSILIDDCHFGYLVSNNRFVSVLGHVAGSFKPPIASKSPGLEAPIETGNNLDPIVNEKLKHLDPKMVELIQNEIMDKGAQVEWSDIAGKLLICTSHH